MRYLTCFLFPPLAVLLCGKPMQALLNCGLSLLLILPGVVHALLVVNATLAEERQDRLIQALRSRRVSGNGGVRTQETR